jgi:hypothetical protein
MGLSTQASDWQVCGVMQVAGAATVGAGWYVFDFYSATAGICGRFNFRGGGIGAGGNASGTALPIEGMGFSPWSSIETDHSFSLSDLNNCWGRLTSLSIGVAVQVGVLYISAAPRFFSTRAYFHSQNVGGLGTGLGAGGVVFIGGWHFAGVSGNIPASVAMMA